MNLNCKYPVFGGGQNLKGYHDKYNNENCAILSCVGSSGYIHICNQKFWNTHSTLTFHCHDAVNHEYLKYYLKSQQQSIIDLSHVSNQQMIGAKEFKDFQISIPKDDQLIIRWNNKFKKCSNESDKLLSLINNKENKT